MADSRDEPSGADKGAVTTQPTTEATPPPVVPERGAPPPPTGVLGLLVREQSIIVPLVAVVAALVIGGVLIRAQGVSPTSPNQAAGAGDLEPGYYLIEIGWLAAVDGTYKGTATFTPALPDEG